MVELDPRRHPHLDLSYAMTSHSSQRQTADGVLIHVDTELGAREAEVQSGSRLCDRIRRRTLPALDTDLRGLGLSLPLSGECHTFL